MGDSSGGRDNRDRDWERERERERLIMSDSKDGHGYVSSYCVNSNLHFIKNNLLLSFHAVMIIPHLNARAQH